MSEGGARDKVQRLAKVSCKANAQSCFERTKLKDYQFDKWGIFPGQE